MTLPCFGWKAFVEGRDHQSGSSFIMVGAGPTRGSDIELTGATPSDYDFIAAEPGVIFPPGPEVATHVDARRPQDAKPGSTPRFGAFRQVRDELRRRLEVRPLGS